MRRRHHRPSSKIRCAPNPHDGVARRPIDADALGLTAPQGSSSSRRHLATIVPVPILACSGSAVFRRARANEKVWLDAHVKKRRAPSTVPATRCKSLADVYRKATRIRVLGEIGRRCVQSDLKKNLIWSSLLAARGVPMSAPPAGSGTPRSDEDARNVTDTLNMGDNNESDAALLRGVSHTTNQTDMALHAAGIRHLASQARQGPTTLLQHLRTHGF